MRTDMTKTLLATLLALAGATPAWAQPWLVSARPEAALNVGNKMALKQPRVEYTVTMPGGKTTTAVAEPAGGGDRAGTVHYPSDFGNAGTQLGEYRWTAKVDGQVVMSGRFSYVASKDGQTLHVP